MKMPASISRTPTTEWLSGTPASRNAAMDDATSRAPVSRVACCTHVINVMTAPPSSALAIASQPWPNSG